MDYVALLGYHIYLLIREGVIGEVLVCEKCWWNAWRVKKIQYTKLIIFQYGQALCTLKVLSIMFQLTGTNSISSGD